MIRRSPKHVCIVRQGPNEPTLQREWRALRDAGFTVDVIHEWERGSPWHEVTEGVHLYRLPVRRGRSGAFRYVVDYLAFFALATILLSVLHVRRPYRYVQVTTMPDFLVFCAVPAKLLGARVIGFFKEPTPELGGVLTGSTRVEAVLRTIERPSLWFCDRVLTVTDELRSLYVSRGADGAKISVVVNSTEELHHTDPERPIGDPSEFRIFMHGSIEHRYGHETVLRALSALRASVPGATFTVCGKGTYVDSFMRLVDELDLNDSVQYLGFVPEDELAEAMGRADVGVVAQLSSPYSNVVHTVKMHDYMDAGLPIVASRLDATAASFGPTDIAYFEPGDPASLFDVLLSLHNDRAELARRARASRSLHRRAGWPAERPKYLAAFAEERW